MPSPAPIDAAHTLSSAIGLTRWDDLRILLAVLRAGSFSAAARELAVEQSTVSRRVSALERELGVLLFDRVQDGLRPSELAGRVRERVELIEAQVLSFADAVRGDARAVEGSVRLALTDSFAVQVVIPMLLGELRQRHPALRVELLGSDQSADLGRREADLALRFYRPSSGDLTAKRLARLPVAVLASRRYLRAREREARRQQKSEPRARRRRSAAAGAGVAAVPRELDWISVRLPGVPPIDAELMAQLRVEPRLLVSSHLAQVEAVRAGLGVALLTRALCQLDRQLVELDLGLALAPPVELWLVCPRALRTVPRVAAVWDLFEERLAALDDGD